MGTRASEHDVVVIGSGHNGLVAACELARKGFDVVVVERNQSPGGMTASSKAFPAAPDHVVNHCAVDLAIWNLTTIERDLELARFGLKTLKVDPGVVYLHPDGESVAIWRDPRRTAEELRRFHPADADAYLEFARFLDALLDLGLPLMTANPTRPGWKALARVATAALRHRSQLKDLPRFLLSSGEDVVERYFRHPVSQAAMGFLSFPPLTEPMSSRWLICYAIIHRGGMTRPVGGMQSLPETLVRCLRASNGTVLTGASVEQVTVRGNRAVAVELADGRTIAARRAVISTCDPGRLARMLPSGSLPDEIERELQNLPANDAGTALFKVDLALSGRLDLAAHQERRDDGLDLRIPSHIIGTPESCRRGCARAAAGLLPEPEGLGFWNVIPTAVDPSQAPPGQDTLYVSSETMPARPEVGWAQAKDDAADVVMKRVSEFYGGIADLEIDRIVETPDECGDRTGGPNGCYWHVDMVPGRSGGLRPVRGLGGYATPITGLFLGGAGSHPGGGVTGIPGHLAAQEVLRSVRRSADYGIRQDHPES